MGNSWEPTAEQPLAVLCISLSFGSGFLTGELINAKPANSRPCWGSFLVLQVIKGLLCFNLVQFSSNSFTAEGYFFIYMESTVSKWTWQCLQPLLHQVPLRCLSIVKIKCVSALRTNKSLRICHFNMLSLMKKFQSQGTSRLNNGRNTGPFISQTSQRFLSPFITCSCIPLPLSSLHSLAGLGLLCSKVKNCSELLSSHCLSHFLAFPLVCIIFIISSKGTAGTFLILGASARSKLDCR